MIRTRLSENITTTKESVINIFGDFLGNIENISQAEFDDCIDYAKEKGWENWRIAWENWKEKDEIPFEDIE